MNTSDLVDRLAASDDKITKAQAKQLVDAVLEAMRASLVSGEEVNLPGFGKFKVQDKPARTGRNPATGETITIPAKKVLKFRIAKAAKDAIVPAGKK